MSALAALWYISGLLGSALFWLNWVWNFDRPPYCPTPRAIIIWAIAAVVGPVLLVSAVLVWLTELIDKGSKTDNWFTRPICRRKGAA